MEDTDDTDLETSGGTQEDTSSESVASATVEDEEEFGGPVFSPPLYRQRYQTVADLVKKYRPRRLVDFGCAEGKLIRFLKPEESLEQLIGIDIEGEILESIQGVIRPLLSDYVQPRQRPFTVGLYQGSIAECDDRFREYDMVTCVEVIEHLDPPILDAMPSNVFGHMRPSVVVVTTPNAEFNVLFPNFSGFRNADHRFEWTRQEFQDWAEGVAHRFSYAVTFHGIGTGPEGSEHLGCCTQMAIFERLQTSHDQNSDVMWGTPYKLIAEAVFPYRENTLSQEQQILQEVQYYIRQIIQRRVHGEEEEDDDNEDATSPQEVSIPLDILMKFQGLKRVCPDVQSLQSALVGSDDVKLSQDKTAVVCCMDKTENNDDDDDDCYSETSGSSGGMFDDAEEDETQHNVDYSRTDTGRSTVHVPLPCEEDWV
ncbi:PREDICTED: small RNA 2'-O-methyltransferase-like [Branchiostoma belcheri]|uniref:Small RNA 2'-O-methyltransferase n=1 Tax=Branchiostoma belcheri TaxID=7741 RepID=A0A6P5A3A2_BRABE|nr:PREDICTED: small RNA 2'-O-methyltransferase-like [Branchiostoma belcheri]XP_019640795.1 PREDICTED: small RNA 2'-O-methyltransferase-like [Branchiostoma belcheri]